VIKCTPSKRVGKNKHNLQEPIRGSGTGGRMERKQLFTSASSLRARDSPCLLFGSKSTNEDARRKNGRCGFDQRKPITGRDVTQSLNTAPVFDLFTEQRYFRQAYSRKISGKHTVYSCSLQRRVGKPL